MHTSQNTAIIKEIVSGNQVIGTKQNEKCIGMTVTGVLTKTLCEYNFM